MIVFVLAAGALGTLPPLLAGILWDRWEWKRHCAGAIPMLLGLVLLASTTLASCGTAGPGTPAFVVGVAVSVCLGWAGYRMHRSRPRESPEEMLLAMLAAPVPSHRGIQPKDVLGPWQFYVDSATSMVIVDLQADGRYTQVIIGNRGEQSDCPGGTWALDGPQVELTSYRSAARPVTDRARWLFGDWQKELVLFAKDDPQGTRMLLGQRRAAPTVHVHPA
jgi:hypothetical protein